MSFFSLYESSRQDNWFKSDDDGGFEVIQKGLELRSDRTDGNTFWDDFIAIFGQNTDEAAKLLGVPQDKVAKWPNKIKKLLTMVRQENDDYKKKSHMIKTGIK